MYILPFLFVLYISNLFILLQQDYFNACISLKLYLPLQLFNNIEVGDMEEELSLDNILGADEIENLFTDEEETQETPPANE